MICAYVAVLNAREVKQAGSLQWLAVLNLQNRTVLIRAGSLRHVRLPGWYATLTL